MKQSHVLFIDDSGTKDYSSDPAKYNLAGRGSSRYFIFCGVLVSMTAATVLTSEIIRLKLEYFGDDTVEIKSNWLRMPHERQAHYLDVYEISEDELQAFVENLYEVLLKAELVLIASVVDKLQMQEDYERPWYAPAVAYETLLLRVQGALTAEDKVAVIIDDTTGKTPKGNEFKVNLIRHHAQLRRSGSVLHRATKFPSLTTQKFVGSHISHVVQLADICAYNVHRQFQMYGENWESGGVKKLPLYEYFAKINRKFRHNGAGLVQGYGIVKMPQRKKIMWTIAEKEKPVP